MYNYYQYEKNRLEEINKIKQARKALNLSIHHKELNKKLVSNYNNKIKKFIVDLVKKPIIIQDYSSPVVTTRKQLINEENKKPEQPKKDFVFRGFLTEKERIKKYLEENEIPQHPKKHRVNKLKKIIQQPKMRFKPRTELERIVDALNHYNYNKKNTEIVKKQIKKMDFNTVKKLKIQSLNKLNYSLYTSSDSESSYSDEEGPGKIGQYRNKIIKKKEIKDKKKDTHFDKIKAANLSMRELMSDYHHKTHFKGAKQLVDSLHKTKLLSKSSSHFFSQSTKSFKLSRNSNLLQKTPKIELETTQQINKSILSNFSGKFPINQENFDIIKNNPLLYNLKIGERNRNESKVDSYEDKINYLKNLINQSPNYSINKYSNLVKILSTRAKTKNQFGNLFNFDQETEEEENSAKILEEGDKVLIDDEMIPISNIELIANKMLKKCNVIHSKSSSNGGQLKKGAGKLMITSGMTLNDFKEKYKI